MNWEDELDWAGAPGPTSVHTDAFSHPLLIEAPVSGPGGLVVEGEPLGVDADSDCDQWNETDAAESATQDDADEEERNFQATKPWLGALYPPRKYREDPHDPKNLKTVFSHENNNWAAPTAKIELDYIFGYRARNCRSNAHWIDEDSIVFFAGAVCIRYKIKEDDQDFFLGHDDDVVCIDYHRDSGLCASGSIGARDTVRLCIWDARTQETKQVIMGFHMFAVTSVYFNPAGTIVASLGMDEHHSLALHSVETGQLLACCQTDKSRVLQVNWNTSEACADPNSYLVTCGVKHIAFWAPADGRVKGGQYYTIANEDVDKRLRVSRGTKCSVIDRVTFQCIESTPKVTLAGANDGTVYAFDSAAYCCVYHLALGKTPVQAIVGLADRGRTVAVGTRDGMVRLYDIHDHVAEPSTVCTTGDGATVLNINTLDEATDNESDVLVNSVRSLSYEPATQQLLVGTILSHLYAVSLPLSKAKLSAKTFVGAHWGQLAKADGYGEIWGVDCHPTKQTVFSCSMDGTVREWDLEANRELRRMHLRYAATSVSVSTDGAMVAVGHLNGGFTVVNGALDSVVWPFTRNRVRRVKDVQFSPNRRFLAVAAEMAIDVYSVVDGDAAKTRRGSMYGSTKLGKRHPLGKTTKVLRRVGVCRGHTALLRHLDWNLASTLIQCTSSACELLYYSVPDCHRVTGAKHLADQEWWTQTCEFGWGVQGIWPRFADATDINSCGKSHSGQLLAITNDSGEVIVYNAPCVGSGMDRFGHLEDRPQGVSLRGHSSHVTNCSWSPRDKYLVTVGGADLCIFVWKVTYAQPPLCFVDATLINIMQQQLDEAVRRKSTAALHSPLSTGAFPKEFYATQDPDERVRRLQERLIHKQRPDPPAKDCPMCGYDYAGPLQTTCPRCMMPRKLRRGAEDIGAAPPIVKAPKLSRQRSTAFVDGIERAESMAGLQPSPSTFVAATSPVLRPTKSFAEQARQSRRMRAEFETRGEAPVFRSTVRGGVSAQPSSKVRCRVDIESDDSDHDEKLIRAALAKRGIRPTTGGGERPRTVSGEKGPGKPGASTVKKKVRPVQKGPSTCGPDFRDV